MKKLLKFLPVVIERLLPVEYKKYARTISYFAGFILFSTGALTSPYIVTDGQKPQIQNVIIKDQSGTVLLDSAGDSLSVNDTLWVDKLYPERVEELIQMGFEIIGDVNE